MTGWNPDADDRVLLGLHAAGLTDREITIRMIDAGRAVCAQDVAAARRRLHRKANKPALAPVHEPKYRDKHNPLAGAKQWLGKRLVEKPGGYFLDGVPVGLLPIMHAYNRMRVGAGAPQIDVNPAWKVPE